MKSKKIIIITSFAFLILATLIIVTQFRSIFSPPITSLVKNIFEPREEEIPKIFRQLAKYGIPYEKQILLIEDLANYYRSIPPERKEKLERLLLEYVSNVKNENYIKAQREGNYREMNRIAQSHITKELKAELLPILDDIQRIIDSYTPHIRRTEKNRNILNCLYSSAMAISLPEDQYDMNDTNQNSETSSNTSTDNNTGNNSTSSNTSTQSEDNKEEPPTSSPTSSPLLPTTTKPRERGRRLPKPFDKWRKVPPDPTSPFPKQGGRLEHDSGLIIDYGKSLLNGSGFILREKDWEIGIGIKNSHPSDDLRKIKPMPVIGGGGKIGNTPVGGYVGHDFNCTWKGGVTIRF